MKHFTKSFNYLLIKVMPGNFDVIKPLRMENDECLLAAGTNALFEDGGLARAFCLIKDSLFVMEIT